MIRYKLLAVTGVAAMALSAVMSEDSHATSLVGQSYDVNFTGYTDCYHFGAAGDFDTDLRGDGTENYHQKVLTTRTHYTFAGLSGSGIAYGGSGIVRENASGVNATLRNALEVDENGATSGAAFGTGVREDVCAASATEGADIPGQ